MNLYMVIQAVFPYPSAAQSSSWLSSWSFVRGSTCSAAWAQAFLPQGMGVLVHGSVLDKQLTASLEITIFAHFAKFLKAVSVVAIAVDAADLYITLSCFKARFESIANEVSMGMDRN